MKQIFEPTLEQNQTFLIILFGKKFVIDTQNFYFPKLSSKLATAESTNLKLWKDSIITSTNSKNGLKLFLQELFKQTFQITAIKHNIVRNTIITKCIPSINIQTENNRSKIKYKIK